VRLPELLGGLLILRLVRHIDSQRKSSDDYSFILYQVVLLGHIFFCLEMKTNDFM
jgi:hypothetical protein